MHDGKQILDFFHPSEALATNLRAHISTVLPALKCQMDIQTSDGKDMLHGYAASYVSKWHDAFNSDVMFSTRTGPYQVAYRHLRGLRPCEPEMRMSLSAKRLAWSQSRTKRFTANTQSQASLKTHEKTQCAYNCMAIAFFAHLHHQKQNYYLFCRNLLMV